MIIKMTDTLTEESEPSNIENSRDFSRLIIFTTTQSDYTKCICMS